MAKMSYQETTEARAIILRFCDGQGRSTSDILGCTELQPFIGQYDRIVLRDLIYALEETGLLFSRGKHSGRMYITTKTGRDLIE